MIPVVLPQYGNSVESCVIVAWRKGVGDPVRAGEVLAEVETDKAVLEVESPVEGVLLALLVAVGDDVPVRTVIAHIGAASESATPTPVTGTPDDASVLISTPPVGVSPRARGLAAATGIDPRTLSGTGPGGRVIERDVRAAVVTPSSVQAPRLTPVARAMVASGDYVAPPQGSGRDGRIFRRDLSPNALQAAPSEVQNNATTMPLTPIRRRIASRMRDSLATTAQLTLHTRADARALRRYRAALKASAPNLGVNQITITDLILFAVARTLTGYPDLNAHFIADAHGDAIHSFAGVDLAFAVDTPRGLLVPVIRNADSLTLRALSDRAAALADAAADGRIAPDALHGGTFTVSNLGSFGVDYFTPILNPPQVAILGVGAIALQPIETDGGVEFQPRIALSLTIDHQAVDGAPAARFLAALCAAIAVVDLLTAG